MTRLSRFETPAVTVNQAMKRRPRRRSKRADFDQYYACGSTRRGVVRRRLIEASRSVACGNGQCEASTGNDAPTMHGRGATLPRVLDVSPITPIPQRPAKAADALGWGRGAPSGAVGQRQAQLFGTLDAPARAIV
jgi:hypothetical protein